MNGWTITFTDGTEERTPEGTEKLRVVDDRLYAIREFNYAPDEILSTYVLTNVRKWVRDR